MQAWRPKATCSESVKALFSASLCLACRQAVTKSNPSKRSSWLPSLPAVLCCAHRLTALSGNPAAFGAAADVRGPSGGAALQAFLAGYPEAQVGGESTPTQSSCRSRQDKHTAHHTHTLCRSAEHIAREQPVLMSGFLACRHV